MLVLNLKQTIILDLRLHARPTPSPPYNKVSVPPALLIGVPVNQLTGSCLAFIMRRLELLLLLSVLEEIQIDTHLRG